MFEFLKSVCECQKAVSMEIKIPGCILVDLKNFLNKFDFEEVVFSTRNPRTKKPPAIRRDWRFSINF
jgi:hypothetical protein